MDDEYTAYLKDKSVVIVNSHAYNLLENDFPEYGHFIDSHDVVIRLHQPVSGDLWTPPPFVPYEFRPVVGKRADVLYAHFHSSWQYDSVVQAVKSFLANDGKFIIYGDAWQAIRCFGTIYDLIECYMPVRTESSDDVRRFIQAEGFFVIAGLKTLIDLWKREMKSLHMVGFTCYVSKQFPEGAKWCDILSKPNFNYLRKLCEKHETLTVDPCTQELFDTIDSKVPSKGECRWVFHADEEEIIL